MACTASRTGRQLQRYNHGCRQVVGCIPYRKINQSPSFRGALIEELEVLMISSQKSPRMMFPKGGWEMDESMKEAAARETEEEAGVIGTVGPQLGKWSFESRSQGTTNEGYMFSLLVTEERDVWPEQNVRKRRWMSVKDAREACVHGWMKEALDVLVGQLLQARKEKEQHGGVSVGRFLNLPRKDEKRGDALVGQLMNFQRKQEEELPLVLIGQLLHLPRKEEEFRDVFVGQWMHMPRCSLEALIVLVGQLLHLPRKREELRDVFVCQWMHMPRCSLEALISEEPSSSSSIISSPKKSQQQHYHSSRWRRRGGLLPY